MNSKEMLELTDCYNLDLHQQFALANFRKGIKEHKDIEELKELLVESMRQIMAKDNMIKCLVKKVI